MTDYFEQPKPVMSEDELLAFGFKEYPINKNMDKHDRHWQYCFRTSIGKKFFVNVRLWLMEQYSTPERKVENGWDAECQFDMRGEKTFDVRVSVNDMLPAQVVEWFNIMFDKMGCQYYEKYDVVEEENLIRHCKKCRAWLSDAELQEPFLCSNCTYEFETGGLKQPAIKRRRKRVK